MRVGLVVEGLSTSPGVGFRGWEGVAREKWKHRTSCREPCVGFSVGGTLLGPERTAGPPVTGGLLCSSGRSFAGFPGVGSVVAVRVVVENCTVDASIFCFCAVCVVIS